MVPSRKLISLCAVVAISFAACSSDAKKSSTGTGDTTTSSSGPITQVIPQDTTTTQATTPQTIATIGGGATSESSTSSSSPSTATTTVGRTVTSPSDNVKKGDKGKGVEQIQAALKRVGYKLSVDGDFGAVTDKAVKDFQKKNGLTQDGVVGPKTWAKLNATTATTGNTTPSTSTTVKP